MAPHVKDMSTGPQGHFSQEQRELACAFFRSAFNQVRKRLPSANDTHGGKAGKGGDDIWSIAWQNYQASERGQEVKPIATRRQFRTVVRRWYARNAVAAPCRRLGSYACDLTASEIDLCVNLLSTPLQRGENYHYFETIAECIAIAEHGDRLSALLARKKMSPHTLHRLLVDKLHVLKYGRCDCRDELPESTLKLRRECAAKWAGKAHWMELPSARNDSALVKSYFKWEWYFDLTLMIDAVCFEDGAQSGKQTQRVYKALKKVYGPQLQKPKKQIDASSRMMFYVMIHRREGIVKGPDLMYTGSRVPQRLAPQKGSILAPWYAQPQTTSDQQ